MRGILSNIIFPLAIVVTLTIGCSESFSPGMKPPPPGYPFLDEFPTLSADGTRVIYDHRGIVEFTDNGHGRFDPDSVGLWMVGIDGSNPHIILNAVDGGAQWSPGGEWIAFQMNGQIYKARISGDHLDTLSMRQLTSEGYNLFPSWSSDGEWISYESNASYPGTLLFDIWKMKNDGSQKTVIREHSRFAHWSPGGDRIVHLYLGDGKQEMYTMDVSGENLTWVTTGGNWPKYSPDGIRIVFTVSLSIFIVNDDGGELHEVFDGGGYPSWSPVGDEIVFSRANFSDPNNHGTIWIMSADGTDLRQITHGPGE